MGKRNYLIEGISGTGKTSACTELQRRGYQAIHGDRELRYQGDLETGTPTDIFTSDRHKSPLWDREKVQAFIANKDEAVTFFCGGIVLDATQPLVSVVDEILRHVRVSA